MGRDAGNLKSKQVEKLIQAAKPGKHYDGQGLRLEIKGPNNRYQIDGLIRYMGLGSAKTFNLAEARERNRKLVRQKLADGVDPVAIRRADRAARQAEAAKAMTFAEASRRFIEQHNGKWASLKHCSRWEIAPDLCRADYRESARCRHRRTLGSQGARTTRESPAWVSRRRALERSARDGQ